MSSSVNLFELIGVLIIS